GVDDDAVLMRDISGVLRRHAARGVVAIGQEDQQPLLRRAVLECLDGKPDRVADRGLLARHTDLRLLEQLFGSFQILREWHLYISLGAKQDQRDAVTLAARDEIADDMLDAVKPRQCRTIRAAEIALVHRAGYIDREDEIARRDLMGQRIAHPLR